MKYGMLTVLEKTDKRYKNEVVYKFECACGEIIERSLCAVKRNTKLGYMCSCGKHTTENKTKTSRENIKKFNKENLKNNTNSVIITKEDAYATNKIGMKGVSYDKKRNKYVAQIAFKKKHYTIGRFDTVEDAKKAYDKKREELLKGE